MQTLDPDAWQGQILVDQGTIFEGLVGYDTQYHIVPKIATHWTTSKDGLTWTFYLRRDARWSNGKTVTADDFYYAWMRFASPQDSQAPMWESFLQFVKNGWNFHGGAAKADEVGVKVINSYELQITLAQPHPSLIGWFALASAVPLYKPSVEAHPTNWFLPPYFVGNGPYKVKSFVPNGQIALVRNSEYVGAKGEFNVGNVKGIDLIPTPSTPVETYMSGQLDIAPIGNPGDYQYVRYNKTLHSQLQITPQWEVDTLTFDKSMDPSPLDNPLVRKAIAEAIDRSVISDKVLNGMVQQTQVLGPPDWPSAKYEHGIPENIADAKKLLTQAGYPHGKGIPTLEFYTPTVGDPKIGVAEAVAQQLKQNLNIDVKIEPTPGSLLGGIIWGSYNKGILPGFVIGVGVVNWWDSSSMDMQTFIATAGSYPSDWRKYVGAATIVTNNPYSVKAYGNPDNIKLGTGSSDLVSLQKAFDKDNAYLINYITSQTDEVYRKSITPIPSNASTWQGYLQAWKQAKTDADKHAAWVNAWNFIGNSGGLDMQVWQDQHRPDDAMQWTVLAAHENADDMNQAAVDGGRLAQSVIDSAWMVPLYDPKDLFLVKPWLTNVVYNKFSWGNFFQLQYLTIKK